VADTIAAPRRLLSRDDVARALGVSGRTGYRLTASGDLAPVRVGPGRRLVRYLAVDVAALIQRSREGRPPAVEPASPTTARAGQP